MLGHLSLDRRILVLILLLPSNAPRITACSETPFPQTRSSESLARKSFHKELVRFWPMRAIPPLGSHVK